MNPTSQELAAAREIENRLPPHDETHEQMIVANATIIHKHNDWKARQSELMHKKFFFQPHPDDSKKCNCAYCARDFEAVAEHAAYLEMDVHSLERERDEWKACAEALAAHRNMYCMSHGIHNPPDLTTFNQLKEKSK